MIQKSIFIASAILILNTMTFTQGTTGFELLRCDVSGRGSAMASALVSVESGIDALYYNPAALGVIEDHRTNVSYFKQLLDIETGFLAYGQKVGNWGTFGLGINYTNYGVFHETTAFGEQTGETFRAIDFLFTLGYGRKINKNFSIGANFKYIRSQIWDVSSSAVAMDFGGLFYVPYDSAKFGFGIFNLGQTLEGYYDYKDKLPLCYKIGVSQPLAHLPLEIALQLEKYQDSNLYFSAGGEFTISEILLLRLGWSTRGGEQHVGTDSDIFAGASVGLGIQTSGVVVDYSLTSMGELGTFQRFSIGGEF